VSNQTQPSSGLLTTSNHDASSQERLKVNGDDGGSLQESNKGVRFYTEEKYMNLVGEAQYYLETQTSC